MMKIKNIPINLIDIADENVRKSQLFGFDQKDELIKEHLSKFDLLQPVIVRFDDKSKRYKLLIGRRRFFALNAKGDKEVPAVVTQMEGAEAEAASLFENLIRKNLSPVEKALMVKRLVDSTKLSISKFSLKYGLPKSTISEWVSILSLPRTLQENIERGLITTHEAIKIARKPKNIQERLVLAVTKGRLHEEMNMLGLKRGAPRGLLTIRLVFNPRKKLEKQMWDKLNQKARDSNLEVTEYVRKIVCQYVT